MGKATWASVWQRDLWSSWVWRGCGTIWEPYVDPVWLRCGVSAFPCITTLQRWGDTCIKNMCLSVCICVAFHAMLSGCKLHARTSHSLTLLNARWPGSAVSACRTCWQSHGPMSSCPRTLRAINIFVGSLCHCLLFQCSMLCLVTLWLLVICMHWLFKPAAGEQISPVCHEAVLRADGKGLLVFGCHDLQDSCPCVFFSFCAWDVAWKCGRAFCFMDLSLAGQRCRVTASFTTSNRRPTGGSPWRTWCRSELGWSSFSTPGTPTFVTHAMGRSECSLSLESGPTRRVWPRQCHCHVVSMELMSFPCNTVFFCKKNALYFALVEVSLFCRRTSRSCLGPGSSRTAICCTRHWPEWSPQISSQLRRPCSCKMKVRFGSVDIQEWWQTYGYRITSWLARQTLWRAPTMFTWSTVPCRMVLSSTSPSRTLEIYVA